MQCFGCEKIVYSPHRYIVFCIHCPSQLGFIDNHGRYGRDDSSASDDGGDSQSTIFIIGSGEYLNQTPTATTQGTPTSVVTVTSVPLVNNNLASSQTNNNVMVTSNSTNFSNLTSSQSINAISTPQNTAERLVRTKCVYRRNLLR